MASISFAHPWHRGEQVMHKMTNVPEYDNPTSYALTPQAAYMLQSAPLLAIGTLDSELRPWVALWGGESGFAKPLGGGIVGVRADIDIAYDPVAEAFIPKSKRKDGEVVRSEGEGKIFAGLTIDLMTRKRVKIAGKMIAGAVGGVGEKGIGEIQAAVKIEQSLGNCPKYLNRKDIRPAPAHPELLSTSLKLTSEGIALLAKADLFFISSSQENKDMDANHRGGPPGFVRVVSNSEDGAEIIYPEYSGNRLYQTLGNLMVTPRAGIVIPDFETGDVLYLTGDTEVLVGEKAEAMLPRSNLAVKIKIVGARFVKQGLPFRGIPGEYSPYNPAVRTLSSEGGLAAQTKKMDNTARLLERIKITQTISRYRFAVTNPVPYKAGQWVALDFSQELDIGYSHMRDDDPKSLNDDFIRTFTVSSPPLEPGSKPQDQFEITVRQSGPVTAFLAKQNPRSALEVPLRGFGGEFVIETPESGGTVPFIAGGVGITPLLGQLSSIEPGKLSLYWTIAITDIDLVLDTFERHETLGVKSTIFFTAISLNTGQHEHQIQAVRDCGAMVHLRRPDEDDFASVEAEKWYICAGLSLRTQLLNWLRGRTVFYENFDY
ncbi:oxidoreductase-like protein [Venturia nashicola]|nr:oxidoreductase-like protein [Venturia nashicola]